MPRALTLFVAACLAVLLALPAAAVPTTTAAASTTLLLVKVARGGDAQAAHAAARAVPVHRIPGIRVDVVEVARDRADAALRAYRLRGDVVYAERNRLVRLAATPNDEFVAEQYALRHIRARKGWGEYGQLWRRTGGAPIAIIDSGIDMTHPEFQGKVSHCRSFLTGTGRSAPTCQDSQVHGTHVAGIAAAAANNGDGIAGVAFDSPIMALQVINSSGYGFTADVAAAIVYAARNGAKVANYSLSAPTSSRTEQDAVGFAKAHKVTQVGAAGNTGKRGVEYPARYKRVIAVGATGTNDSWASYSTYGPQVEVAAPGTRVLSTIPGTVLYARLDGTSMAAPHVSGLAALLRSRGYGPKKTRRLIREGAADLGPAGRDEKYGFGRINVARSLP